MVELFRDGFSSRTAQQCRIAFYHNLSPDNMNQTITAELIKHRDKHIAEKYGVQLNAVYVDHADTERPAFEKIASESTLTQA